MHGRRRSGLARELREQAIASQRSAAAAANVGADAPLEDTLPDGVTRRQLLVAGGALAGTLWLGEAAVSRAARRGNAPDARVAVIGAGLAGAAAAYQLHRVGIHVEVYEARERLGGRCWSARGFADGQIAEHGGEFIDTRHVHIRQLARRLGLHLDDLYAAKYGDFSPNLVGDRLLPEAQIRPQMNRIASAANAEARRLGVLRPNGSVTQNPISYPTATEHARQVDQLSMTEWLDRHVPGVVGTRVAEWLDQTMCGWYGLNLDQLSALNWIDFFVIPYPGGDERWHVRGGNDQIVHRAVAALPVSAVHVQTPLRGLRRKRHGYELHFDGHRRVHCDLVILTLPFTTLREVDLSGAGLSRHKLAAIHQLAMGFDSKVLVQYDRRPWRMHDWSSFMTSTDPDFDTWESSAMEPGHSGLITVYAGGRTGRGWTAPTPHGPAPAALRDAVLGRIDQALPGSAMRFNGHAWADLWPHDPWTRGSYAAFGPGQYTRFWRGTAQADGGVHFAGEATSTYSQGFLNGGVESGYRAAIEVMRRLGVRVPRDIAELPYSPA